jgi:MFS family permease
MAFFVYPLWIFFVRTIDRFGKGIRTGARDAILSDEATPETKGKIFGFHRAMDTLGAVLGPSLALIYLHFYPKDYINLFYIAFLPGILAVFSSSFLKEKKQVILKEKVKTNFFSFLNYWKESPENYRKVVIGLLFFTLFNSSDVFLLLKAKDAGLTDTAIIGVYIFYNLIFALFSFPLGILADKIGLKKMFVFGISIFAIVYFGMSFQTDITVIAGLFFLYGIYAAATEGISKAWITNISYKKDTATSIGTYTALQSICTMLASSLAGLVWYKFGANMAFMVTGIAAVILIFYFSFGIKSVQQKREL